MKFSLNSKETAILIFLVITGIFLSNSPDRQLNFENNGLNPISSQIQNLQFNSTNAYNLIKTQLEFGFRIPGQQAHLDCADWIRSELNDRVDSVITHNFTVQGTECQNILGKINDNKNLSQIFILGAHWDSRAISDRDPIAGNRSEPVPGANDGGSGVAVLLELARVLYDNKDDINSQIWFLFLDAEDQGSGGLPGWGWCEGSTEFVAEIDNFYNSSTEEITGFLLLDMVGGTDLVFIKEARSSSDMQTAIFNEGQNLGYNTAFPSNPKVMSITDDHIAFVNKGIPSVDLIINFIDGPWEYHHTTSDSLENIDKYSLEITGRTVESFIYQYLTGDGPPNWEIQNNSWTDVIIISILILAVAGITLYVIYVKKFK